VSRSIKYESGSGAFFGGSFAAALLQRHFGGGAFMAEPFWWPFHDAAFVVALLQRCQSQISKLLFSRDLAVANMAKAYFSCTPPKVLLQKALPKNKEMGRGKMSYILLPD